MPRAIPQPRREQLAALCQQGWSAAQIARELELRPRTVRDLCQRLRTQGAAGLHIRYAQCGRRGAQFPAAVHAAALQWKRDHPGWGGGLIRLELAQQFPDAPLPAVRTLQAWFQAARLNPSRAQKPPVTRERARRVHEVWQVDAKERMRLADGSGTCVLTVTDEASGTLLGAVPFPPVSLDPGASGRRPGRAGATL